MTTETLQKRTTLAGNALLVAQLQTANGGLDIGTEVQIRADHFSEAMASGRRFPPTGALAQSFDRSTGPVTAQTAAASATQQFTAINLVAGQTIANITFVNGVTAAGTPLNQWFSLYSSALALLAVTADDTTTAWAANASKTLALATPYIVPSAGLYYVGCMVKATTVPTLLGHTNPASSTLYTIAPILTGTDATNNALTNPASAPDPAHALTAGISLAYCYVS